MPTFTPAALISRHIEKLRQHAASSKIDEVLAQAGLTLVDNRVTAAGRDVTAEDCQKYKQAVREVYGDAIYSFAKVNFVLGGCSCSDCNPG